MFKKQVLNLDRKAKAIGALAGIAFLLMTGGAQASALLNGKTVEYTYLFPTITSVYFSGVNGNYAVGPGVEISSGFCCDFEGSLDLSDKNILADFHAPGGYSDGSFNGFRITDVFDAIDPFTSVSINAITNMVGFDASRVTFDANNIWVNWQGLGFSPDTVVSLDINGGQSIPEPGTWLLMGTGLMGLLGGDWYKRRRVA